MEFSEPTACSRPLTRSDETNALGLQKILVLPRRFCFEIVFSKMSPLIRLHRSNHSKYAVHHQGSRGNSPSRHKLQRRASGLVQSHLKKPVAREGVGRILRGGAEVGGEAPWRIWTRYWRSLRIRGRGMRNGTDWRSG